MEALFKGWFTDAMASAFVVAVVVAAAGGLCALLLRSHVAAGDDEPAEEEPPRAAVASPGDAGRPGVRHGQGELPLSGE